MSIAYLGGLVIGVAGVRGVGLLSFAITLAVTALLATATRIAQFEKSAS